MLTTSHWSPPRVEGMPAELGLFVDCTTPGPHSTPPGAIPLHRQHMPHAAVGLTDNCHLIPLQKTCC